MQGNIPQAKTVLGKSYATYLDQGEQSLVQRSKQLRSLFSNRKLPAEGWDELSIRTLLNDLACMDSNNFIGAVSVGEREGRVHSSLVKQRWFGFAHGIGRSGDVTAVQPKAAGSSLMVKIVQFLVLDACRIAGLKSAKQCLVLPTATGMAHFLYFSSLRPFRPSARYIVWMRMDQKSVFKAIYSAGFRAHVVDGVRTGDEVVSDVNTLTALLANLSGESKEQNQKHSTDQQGPTSLDDILCVVACTSSFAPRASDDAPSIAKLCARYNLPFCINNAYGLQSSSLGTSPTKDDSPESKVSASQSKKECEAPAFASVCDLIDKACRVGRVDAVIQSTDKNFMVPVGGSVVCEVRSKWHTEALARLHKARRNKHKKQNKTQPSQDPPSQIDGSCPVVVDPLASESVCSLVSSCYPGRASASPLLDLLITLLEMGAGGWRELLAARSRLLPYYKKKLRAGVLAINKSLPEDCAIRLLDTPSNHISVAVCLDGLAKATGVKQADMTSLGAYLFQRNTTGPRVVVPGTRKTIGDHDFYGWGSSCELADASQDSGHRFPYAYVHTACAIGMTEQVVDAFVEKFVDTVLRWVSKNKKKSSQVLEQ